MLIGLHRLFTHKNFSLLSWQFIQLVGAQLRRPSCCEHSVHYLGAVVKAGELFPLPLTRT